MKMKMIGSIFGLAGGILAFINALGYFLSESLMPNFNYNQASPLNDGTTGVGFILFFIAIIIILLSLFALKHPRAHIHYIILLILGAVVLVMPLVTETMSTMWIAYFSGLLILAGGIIGGIGMYLLSK